MSSVHRTMLPDHIIQFEANIDEVRRLLNIHKQLAGDGPGRKVDVEVLNKSAIVLLVACWEACVEDMAAAGLDFMIRTASDHGVFPESVRTRVSSQKNGLKAWELAGDGWKQALRDNYQAVLKKTTGILNTPRAPEVDELFAKTIGLDDLSKSWQWKGRTRNSAVSGLDTLITLRGAIAHRVKHTHAVRKKDVVANSDLLHYLATKSSNRVMSHIEATVGKSPWGPVSFRSVS